MNSTIQTFYNEWKQQYLATVPYAPDQMYVFYNEDGESDPENAVAVSEGQGYGMIVSAYMGDQENFDSLFRFCLAFPSSITPSLLIGWQQVDEDGTIDYFPDGGDHSATDGDIDVAYALLLADQQWGSSGDINYLAYANTMMSSILSKDINWGQLTLKLGDWVANNDQKFGKATRCSDFILNHLRCFEAASGDARWLSVMDKIYSIINELYINFAGNTGLLPDFVEFKSNAYVPGKPVMYNLSEDEYYDKALSYFDTENDVFIFFSDDTEFVKTMPVLRKIKRYFIIEKEEHWEDFYLMSLCKHHIIANSTFSWWGAYLCQNPAQKVVFPWRWFGPGLPPGYSTEGQEGLYWKAPIYTPMSHWITIE